MGEMENAAKRLRTFRRKPFTVPLVKRSQAQSSAVATSKVLTLTVSSEHEGYWATRVQESGLVPSQSVRCNAGPVTSSALRVAQEAAYNASDVGSGTQQELSIVSIDAEISRLAPNVEVAVYA